MPLQKIAVVIDDDGFIANLVARLLGKRGFSAVMCLDMENALEIIDKSDVSLVITDIYMPGIGGIEGIRQLRERHPDIPVVAMSGGWDKMSAEKTVKAAQMIGADAGMKKPISNEDLDAVLELLEM